MVDVAVIGAGLAGLLCARQLRQTGYDVVVLEKSRGLGGRVATRRLEKGSADHGTRYLEAQGELTQRLIQALSDRDLIHNWAGKIYQMSQDGSLHLLAAAHDRFVSDRGITAIAKFLGEGLEIWRSQRVQAIDPHSDHWSLTLEPAGVEPLPNLAARAIVVAIPAPQALMLFDPLSQKGLPEAFLAMLRSVEFDACLSAIATYPAERLSDLANIPWQGVFFPDDANLAWVGVESSKQLNPTQPIFVVQSSAKLAATYLEITDLREAGSYLLRCAAQALVSWLDTPDIVQVHRWRYAFARTPLQNTCLTTTNPLPLVCSGDWCGGNTIESALSSGLTAAAQINQQLDRLTITQLDF